ncbi:MAG: response regulator [Thermoproteota archaeon]|nr:response regulator [Thermoproteota archaeon]
MIANTHKYKSPSRLLVVDDDPDNAEVIRLCLVNYGFLVDAFTNAEEALQKFKSNPESYSLVLSDSLMPAISGIQLAKIVKETNPNVKVLLLTGSERTDIKCSNWSPSTSVDDFVQKPISIRKLADKILTLISETKGGASFQG